MPKRPKKPAKKPSSKSNLAQANAVKYSRPAISRSDADNKNDATSKQARVIAFSSIGPGGMVTDHQRELRTGTMDQDHTVRFGAAGTHVLVLQTNSAASTLPSIRFNDYLKQEGLTPALEVRARAKAQDQPGRARLHQPQALTALQRRTIARSARSDR